MIHCVKANICKSFVIDSDERKRPYVIAVCERQDGQYIVPTCIECSRKSTGNLAQ